VRPIDFHQLAAALALDLDLTGRDGLGLFAVTTREDAPQPPCLYQRRRGGHQRPRFSTAIHWMLNVVASGESGPRVARRVETPENVVPEEARART
jgi:hypothetical protein